MGTIIDSLTVELNLDPSKFTRGQKEAVESLRKMEEGAKKHGGAVEQSAKGVEQGFAAVQKRLLGVAGLLLGGLGIEQFIQKMTKLQVTTANVSATFGLQSQMLQTWSAAGERAGVSGQGVQQGLLALQQQRLSQQAGTAPSQLMAMARGTLGTANPLVTQDKLGQLLEPEALSRNIAKWLEKEGPKGANALVQLGGLNQDFVSFLMKGQKEVDRLLAESKKLAPTNEEIQRFKQLNESFEKASQLAVRLGTALTAMISPKLVEMFESIAKTSERALAITAQGNPELAKKLGLGPMESLLKSREEQLKTVEDRLAKQGGVEYRTTPFMLNEQKRLREEIEKLRDTIEKLRHEQQGGGGGLQNQSFITSPSQGNIIRAGFSGGGAQFGGGASAGGNTIYGSLGADRSGSGMPGAGSGRSIGPMGAGKRAVAGAAAEEMRAAGLGDEAIAGIFANVQDESSFNPTLRHADQPRYSGEAHYAHGLYQEGGAEWNRYAAWLQKYHAGSDWKDPRLQTRFLMENLKTNYPALWKRLQSARSGGQAGADFVRMYLKPAAGFLASRSNKYMRGVPGVEHYLGPPGTASDQVPIPQADPRGHKDQLGSLMDGARSYAMGGSRGGNSYATTIGDLHVHTAATDSEGIISDLKPKLARFASIASANNGPT